EVYLDDILVHASTQEEHDRLLLAVLETLEKNDFHLKATKCAFGMTTVDFLGHTISQHAIKPMISNVQGILDFPLPSTVQQWQRFHGMMNFYRLHIARFADILRPVAMIMGISHKEVLSPDAIKDDRR